MTSWARQTSVTLGRRSSSIPAEAGTSARGAPSGVALLSGLTAFFAADFGACPLGVSDVSGVPDGSVVVAEAESAVVISTYPLDSGVGVTSARESACLLYSHRNTRDGLFVS